MGNPFGNGFGRPKRNKNKKGSNRVTEQDMIDALTREGWSVSEETGLLSKGEYRELEPRPAYLAEFGPNSLDED